MRFVNLSATSERVGKGSKKRVILRKDAAGQSATLPVLAFGDADTGFFQSSDDVLELTTAGVSRMKWDASGITTIAGNLVVSGTTTTIGSTTLTVDDKNIELGSVATPSDTTADGGGITIKGATDKTFNWVNSTDAWTSSEHINLASGKTFQLNGTAITSTAAELNLLDGVSGLVQADLTKLAAVTSDATELNYTDGVTSAIQTQMNAKAPLASPAFTGTPTGIVAGSMVDGTITSAKIDTMASSKLTGALPAISGVALTGVSKLTVATTAPSSPAAGDLWFDSTALTTSMNVYSGSGWDQMSNKLSATGGTESTYTYGGINYKVHKFTSSGTLTVNSGGLVDVLVVAGGGGGGGSTAGGGGAGGLLWTTGFTVAGGSFSVIVGAGGTGSRSADYGVPNNTVGVNSVFSTKTAIGGGYGFGGKSTGSRLASAGGSGGSGGYYSGNDILVNAGGSGTSGQGYDGTTSVATADWGGCGGGGAGGFGGNNASNVATTRYGGVGVNMSSYFGTSVGASGYFCGGGGGGVTSALGASPGGNGGGGNGGPGDSSAQPTSGSTNTGGGGGAGGFYQSTNNGGGNGGSGIVLIRYLA